MDDLFLHACCGPCATVAVPAWRAEGVEPRLWYWNPNIQPAVEHERRRRSLLRFAAAEEVAIADPERPPCADAGHSAAEAAVRADNRGAPDAGWLTWAASLATTPPDERCAACLRLRLADTAAAAAAAGATAFSTTLSVSPYQRHDLIEAAGRAAEDESGVAFVYLDLRSHFRESHAESRRLGLYRQVYCGCAASKWEAWLQRRARRRAE